MWGPSPYEVTEFSEYEVELFGFTGKKEVTPQKVHMIIGGIGDKSLMEIPWRSVCSTKHGIPVTSPN